ncbi:hypothetical protein QTP70_001870 [Hemibagrus guttatus]|uniref:Ty3 transposon capsid-like protein domain-containing protein n=1 Tax=Hemibagrus guttatus TaxID=175788 RepID=A0AAE0Q906_9TELE|nr:hypothetical protein QTP70_001870 [Hemibagrus guttatus]
MDPSSNPPDPLQDLVAALRQALAALPAPAPTPPTTTSADTVTTSSAPLCSSPMAQPVPYSGSAEDCNGFLLQCSLVLEMQPHLYPTERSKVAFVITQLRGQALLWAESLWSQDSPVTQSYAGFVEHFKEVFGKPSWDSSVGEELCKLRQGKLTITEYALQFRTLAAKSGWNEQALLAAYRQGLSPQVRLHLAAHEDAIGLERLIQLSIRVATRMQSCVHRSQDQSPPYTRRDRPEPVSPPEPAPEPMQLGSTHLNPAERQRRLTQSLCLYCGDPGHALPMCPICPPCPMVSTIFSFLPHMKPLTTHGTLTTAHTSVTVVVLLDSGSVANFVSGTLCRQLGLRTKATATPCQIRCITGKPVSRRRVHHSAGPVLLQVGLLHVEKTTFLVLEESTADIILGRLWLEQHNLILSWRTSKVLKWGNTCFPGCFPHLPAPHSLTPIPLPVQATSIESPLVNQPLWIPTCYTPFSDVFCPKRASKLPPHWPWDCAIDHSHRLIDRSLFWLNLNEAGTVPEVTTPPTVVTDKSETVVPTEDTEKIAVVKEQSGSEGQETIGTSEKTAKNCKHEIVPATVSSMNKCAACVGPVVSLRWIGLRCKVCSCFWHKSFFSKIGKNESELLSWNNELDQVADFLGHDIRVHREYYRLPEATIQLAKISKLLLAMEKGRLPDLQGKSLDDIEIEDEINTDGSARSESENGGEGENLEACTSTPLQIGMRKDQAPNEDEAGAVVQGNVAAEAGNSRKRTRTPWSKCEEVAVMKYFKSHITKGKLATMVECLQ